MISRNEFENSAKTLYEVSSCPTAQYKIAKKYLKLTETDAKLMSLKNDFLMSDIVNELYQEQYINGSFGPLFTKDYTVKAKFPTTNEAIKRCLYIGLEPWDREILLNARAYLEEFMKGTNQEPLYNRNERAIPSQLAHIAGVIEVIEPYNPLNDSQWGLWAYIATRAYDSGEYSYERDRDAQHELLFTKEKRIIPLPVTLLLARREKLLPGIEQCMLHHLGEHAYHNGHFWGEHPSQLPDSFQFKKTRRWFYSINYINQFTGSAEYLENTVEWLMDSRNCDGLWDYGTQIKDPWGYFNYFSTSRDYRHNRIVDCSMEVLDILNTYFVRNIDETDKNEE